MIRVVQYSAIENIPSAELKPLFVCHTAGKRHSYGAVAPHVVLPFVVEHAGALGKDADKFFHAIVKKVRNELNASEEAGSPWSSRGFSNFYYQRIPQ